MQGVSWLPFFELKATFYHMLSILESAASTRYKFTPSQQTGGYHGGIVNILQLDVMAGETLGTAQWRRQDNNHSPAHRVSAYTGVVRLLGYDMALPVSPGKHGSGWALYRIIQVWTLALPVWPCWITSHVPPEPPLNREHLLNT